jgi:hypothetical protein
MLWLALHLPLLSLEAFCATLPAADAQRPVALLEHHHIGHVNAAAARCGLRPGLKRATALALAADLLLGEAAPARDAAALQAVAHAALAFTPAVAHQDAQTLVLEVQASLRLFGGLAALRTRLAAALAPLGHQVQMAAAPTALGAAWLAQWQPVAGDAVLGAHACALPALRTLLQAAPLVLLQAGRAHAQTLQGMGSAQPGRPGRLPRAGLSRRFGAELIDEWDRAWGRRPDPRNWLSLPAVFRKPDRAAYPCRKHRPGPARRGRAAGAPGGLGAGPQRAHRRVHAAHAARTPAPGAGAAHRAAPGTGRAGAGRRPSAEPCCANAWPARRCTRRRWNCACTVPTWCPGRRPTASCSLARRRRPKAWRACWNGCAPGWGTTRCDAWCRWPTTGPNAAAASCPPRHAAGRLHSRWSALGGRLATAPPGLAVARAAAAGRARRAATAAGPAAATAEWPRTHRSRLVGRPGRGARLLHRAGVEDGSLVWVWRARLAAPPGEVNWYLQGRFA